jgi:uncharacterized membrane protein YfcA
MAILAVVAFAPGFVSSIAGTGGLLTLPALLSFGLPPMAALGTNKVQSALGTLSSTWNFYRLGHLHLRELRPSMAAALVGSMRRHAVGAATRRCAVDARAASAVDRGCVVLSVLAASIGQ